MRLNLPILTIASMTLLVFACSTPVSHGHIHEEAAIKAIKPGVTTKDQVQEALGSPSSESSFGLMTWYYISSIKKTRSLLAPVVSEQNVTEVAFNGSGVVDSVKEYTLADGKQVAMVKRVTPTEGQQLGFFEQIMGNLGRFNKDDSKSGPVGPKQHSTVGLPSGSTR
jgi:outer membrane protein assembly factor BamE (lipoprotein component of BamABCDE complex)